MGPWRDGMYGPGGGHGVGIFVVMMLFWLLVAAGVYYFIRHSHHSHDAHHAHAHAPVAAPVDASLDVLRMRFAKGEIDEDEFTKRTTLLRGEKLPTSS